MNTLEDIKSSYDWECAFGSPNGYSMDDISEIIASVDGCNDGDNWVGVFKMNDGKYVYVTAWCDYTGWDCRSGGDHKVSDTLKDIINFGCTEDDRERLGFELM